MCINWFDTSGMYLKAYLLCPSRTRVLPRSGAAKQEAKGIFPGAEVVRGRDWRLGDQDG